MAHPTPTTIVARVLRGLGLRQGREADFYVRGLYQWRKYGKERIGTMVFTRGLQADQVVAVNADLIEQRTAEAGSPFRVSIHARANDPEKLAYASVCNVGSRERELTPEHVATLVVESPRVTPYTPDSEQWGVYGLDEGVLRLEPTMHEAVEWCERYTHLPFQGRTKIAKGYYQCDFRIYGEDRGRTLFIVRSDKLERHGWDLQQTPVEYPYTYEPTRPAARRSDER